MPLNRRVAEALFLPGRRGVAVRPERHAAQLPGRIAARLWIGEQPTTVHPFVYTLGYSRRCFAYAYPNERVPALLDGHERAFRHFGGVPVECLYDNPRTLVLGRTAGTVLWHPVAEDFARYYGFTPRAAILEGGTRTRFRGDLDCATFSAARIRQSVTTGHPPPWRSCRCRFWCRLPRSAPARAFAACHPNSLQRISRRT